MGLPLEGLLVVAVEQAVAAPFCTMRLADAGARVIKIERPGGDFARFYDDATPAGSSYFVWLNRGKESVVLDLARAEARAQLAQLIAAADILVQNLRPGAMERLGLGMAALRQRHPRLINCAISGYRATGEYAGRKAYDLLVQAESGLCSITGGPSEPARVGISVVDIATGGAAHAAILEALIARGRSGEGADICLSMFDVMAEFLTVPLLNAQAGHPPHRIGLAHPSIAPYGVFVSADQQQILISIQSEREWRHFCAGVLENSGLAEDPSFSSNVARVANRAQTDIQVAKVFAMLPRAILVERLAKADIAFAQLNDMAGLANHPELARIGIATAAEPVWLPAPAARFSGAPRQYGPVPAIGQHTQAVLAAFCGPVSPGGFPGNH